jgi:hypothetical protein
MKPLKKNALSLIGALLLPLMYIRVNVLLYIPLFWYIGIDAIILIFVHFIVLGNIMGNFNLLNSLTKLIQRVFKIEYAIIDYWSSDILHSFPVWSHPVLKVRDDIYFLSVNSVGGNLYDKDVQIRRIAILYWFFYYKP